MLIYRYTGTTISGDSTGGFVLGLNQENVRRRLTSCGVICESIQPVGNSISRSLTAIRSGREITRFSRQLSDLLAGGLLFHDAWRLASSQAKTTSIRRILHSLQERIEHGELVWVSLEKEPGYFDSLSVQMIRIGESSGQLDLAFRRIAAFREQRDEILGKVRAALVYPIIVLMIAVAIIALLLTYIVPVFEGLYLSLGATLPSHTKFLIEVSKWLHTNWLLLAVGIVVFIFGVVLLLNTSKVRKVIQRVLLRVPFIGALQRSICVARFTRTLGSMLEAGVGLQEAYSLSAAATDHFVYEHELSAARYKLDSGEPLSRAVSQTGLFPDVVTQFISSGESTGQLGQMLSRVADILEQEVKLSLAQLTKLIEPIVIVILGAIVATILVMIYLPMFELVRV